jgi:hypothetical protein
MIVHVLLFRPAAHLTAADRDALVTTFEQSLADIPLIRRASVGQRRLVGRPYEQAMSDDYPFIATFEFDSLDDLHAYLDHPAHAALAQRFFQSVEAALVYDFEMADATALRTAFSDLI